VELWADSASSAAAAYTVTSGAITVPTIQAFSQGELSEVAYDLSSPVISISDVLLGVKDVTTHGNAWHAADVNNSGKVTISDVLLMVKDIINVSYIDHFYLIW